MSLGAVVRNVGAAWGALTVSAISTRAPFESRISTVALPINPPAIFRLEPDTVAVATLALLLLAE